MADTLHVTYHSQVIQGSRRKAGEWDRKESESCQKRDTFLAQIVIGARPELVREKNPPTNRGICRNARPAPSAAALMAQGHG